MASVELTLIGKPGCHLCDDARAVIESVLTEVADAGCPPVTLVERDVLTESDLFDKYAEEIPVVLLDGRMHTYWRVDRDRLRQALLAPR